MKKLTFLYLNLTISIHTCELEANQKISFLDVLIHHNIDGTLNFEWYHKNTWSGRYLNYESYLPFSYKKNTITILAEKIFKLSDLQYQQKNLIELEDALIRNCYPKKLLQFFIKKARNKIYHYQAQNQIEVEPTKHNYASLPYIRLLFEQIQSLLAQYNFKTVGRNYQNLEVTIFSKLKDQIPKELKSNIVYKVSCSCGSNYIGQSKQYMKKRLYQHQYDVKKTSNISALSQHLKESGHNISIDNVSILANESKYIKRSILEMIHIKKGNNINKQEDSEYIQNLYNNLI